MATTLFKELHAGGEEGSLCGDVCPLLGSTHHFIFECFDSIHKVFDCFLWEEFSALHEETLSKLLAGLRVNFIELPIII